MPANRAAVLDERGRDALRQHGHALVGEGREHAAGVEAAAVVHHDRRLAEHGTKSIACASVCVLVFLPR